MKDPNRRTGRTTAMIARLVADVLAGGTKDRYVFGHSHSTVVDVLVPMFVNQLEALGVPFKSFRARQEIECCGCRVHFMSRQSSGDRLKGVQAPADCYYIDHYRGCD